MAHGPNVDHLELDLESPMLDDVMRSPEMYAAVKAVANEIKAGYVTRVPRDTGDLSSTARVTMHKSRLHRDKRWEADFEVGNSRVDYADEVEARDHPLGETLAAMGYDVVI